MWCVQEAGRLGRGGLLGSPAPPCPEEAAAGSPSALSRDQAGGSSAQPAALPAYRPCGLLNAQPRAPLALWLAWRVWGLLCPGKRAGLRTGAGGQGPRTWVHANPSLCSVARRGRSPGTLLSLMELALISRR